MLRLCLVFRCKHRLESAFVFLIQLCSDQYLLVPSVPSFVCSFLFTFLMYLRKFLCVCVGLGFWTQLRAVRSEMTDQHIFFTSANQGIGHYPQVQVAWFCFIHSCFFSSVFTLCLVKSVVEVYTGLDVHLFCSVLSIDAHLPASSCKKHRFT